MTNEAKVGAFVLGCFAVLAFTVIYLLNAQYSGGTSSCGRAAPDASSTRDAAPA